MNQRPKTQVNSFSHYLYFGAFYLIPHLGWLCHSTNCKLCVYFRFCFWWSKIQWIIFFVQIFFPSLKEVLWFCCQSHILWDNLTVLPSVTKIPWQAWKLVPVIGHLFGIFEVMTRKCYILKSEQTCWLISSVMMWNIKIHFPLRKANLKVDLRYNGCNDFDLFLFTAHVSSLS